MSQNLIRFKGKREGISIYIKKGSFEDIKDELETKIKKSERFFKGAKVIEIAGIDGKKLTKEEKEKIETLITKKYRMIIEENEKTKQENIMQMKESKETIEVEEKKEVDEIKEVEEIEEDLDLDLDLDLECYDGLQEGSTKFITTTIRSGQLIEYDGNVVVIGDVNPGGEISAKGNIVVLGSVRGVTYAGSDGNKDAVVAAFRLSPTQLRIADLITRRPDNDEDTHTPREPEIARIYDDAIIIEPYLTKK